MDDVDADEAAALPVVDDDDEGTSAVDVGSAEAVAPGVALGRRSQGFGGAPRSPVSIFKSEAIALFTLKY